MTSVLNSVIR